MSNLHKTTMVLTIYSDQGPVDKSTLREMFFFESVVADYEIEVDAIAQTPLTEEQMRGECLSRGYSPEFFGLKELP